MRYLPFLSSHYNCVFVFPICHACYMFCPINLLDSTTPNNIWRGYRLICSIFHLPVTYPFVSPNISLSTLLSVCVCSSLRVKDQVTHTHIALLATCFTLVPFLSYSSTMKMDAICPSETSGDFQRITLRYIPEHRTLRSKNNTRVRSPGIWWHMLL
jgi:hypothetical protein